MQHAFVFNEVAVLVRHWFEIDLNDSHMEHGARVEIRLLAPHPGRGSESAAQVIVVDQPAQGTPRLSPAQVRAPQSLAAGGGGGVRAVDRRHRPVRRCGGRTCSIVWTAAPERSRRRTFTRTSWGSSHVSVTGTRQSRPPRGTGCRPACPMSRTSLPRPACSFVTRPPRTIRSGPMPAGSSCRLSPLRSLLPSPAPCYHR